MAAPTSSSTLTIKPQTPDPFFSNLQESKDALFNQTEKDFQVFHPQWEAEYESLETFQVTVRNRGSDFQNEKVKPLPKKEDLEREREGYLTKYWAFKGTCVKIGLYSSELTRRIEFLTPAHLRNYADEERLKSEQPEFLEGMKKHEEICKGYIEKVQGFSVTINNLKGKFLTCIQSDTYNVNWALQRFCQIVDNEGKPLSRLTRLADNLATPVIPKPRGASSMSDSTPSPQPPTASSSQKSNEASTNQAGPSQPQSETSSTEKKGEEKETLSSKPGEKKVEGNEASTTQAPPPPQPRVSSTANKEAPAPSSATTMTDIEMGVLNEKQINQ
jgi:hypothetical protein